MSGAEVRLSHVGVVFRLGPLLLVPVFLVASTFPGRFHVSPIYWMLSCAAALCFAAGSRWPVVASCAISALALPLFAAEAWGLSSLVPYLGAVALADVAGRSDRDMAIAATAVWWATAVLIGNWLDDHTTLWSAANVVTLAAVVGVPVLLGLYLRAQKRLAATYRQQALDAQLRRAVAESAARAQERTAMARELHDLVAHHMAAIVLRIGVAEHVVGSSDPRLVDALDDVHRTAVDALTDVRRLQNALRDPALSEVALIEPAAIWTEIDAAVARTRAAGINMSADIDCGAVQLDAIGRLTLLRVTQEALTNVMKHADVSEPVELIVGVDRGGLTMRVTNACAGSVDSNSDGHGLIGMAERLRIIGGRFQVRRADRSWLIEAWVPARAIAATEAE